MSCESVIPKPLGLKTFVFRSSGHDWDSAIWKLRFVPGLPILGLDLVAICCSTPPFPRHVIVVVLSLGIQSGNTQAQLQYSVCVYVCICICHFIVEAARQSHCAHARGERKTVSGKASNSNCGVLVSWPGRRVHSANLSKILPARSRESKHHPSKRSPVLSLCSSFIHCGDPTSRTLPPWNEASA